MGKNAVKKTVLFERFPGEVRAALLEDGQLTAMYVQDETETSVVGSVYVGRVTRVTPGLNAAFVDIGLEKQGYLFGDDQKKPIETWVKQGDVLVVQVKSEPDGKGVRLTTKVSLPGHGLVYLPMESGVSVSRQIEGNARLALKQLGRQILDESSGGLILRTEAQHCTEAALRDEYDALRELWTEIEIKARTRPPACAYRVEGLLKRILQDWTFDECWCNRTGDVTEGVRLHEDVFLFEHFGVESQWEKALRRNIWLPGGGYLTIDYTEAMTVIDVNTGSAKGRELQETIIKTNWEAAEAIARQIRLRDMGGIIMVDFVDMQDGEKRRMLVEELRGKVDGRTEVFPMTRLGLVEISRKRTYRSVSGTVFDTCPRCGGGKISSATKTASEMVRKAAQWLPHHEGVLEIRVHPKTAEGLLERIMRLDEAAGRTVKVVADERCLIETGYCRAINSI